ncbi:MAG: phosphatase PAP2 family protein [Pseudomonadota bacterium]
MKPFLRWTFVYFIVATAVNTVLRDDALFTAFRVILNTGSTPRILFMLLPFLVVLLALSYRTSDNLKVFAWRIVGSLGALLICCVFLATFSSLKPTMPFMVEAAGLPHFFADPFFADLDNWLHFGVDPWVITHDITHALGLTNFAHHASSLYSVIWAVPAFYLPVIMVLLGDDKRTVHHFLMLYLFSWVALGNVVAPAALSAGPIFYDNIFGTARYTELLPSMMAGGYEGSWFERVQPALWDAYANDQQAVGSGISAFPSLHVALATMSALYFVHKARWLAWVAVPFVLAVLFVSVWCGYHYAIDGYFSIAAILALHWALKRRQAGRDPSSAMAPVAAE